MHHTSFSTSTPTSQQTISNGTILLFKDVNFAKAINSVVVGDNLNITVKLITKNRLFTGDIIEIKNTENNVTNILPFIVTVISEEDETCCIKNKKVWKPNNKKFSKQGAVSSGSRLERLKLDTIKSANSKCYKNNTCIEKDGEKIPTGRYFAGKPRFTGWMYNKDHREKVWGNRNISYIRNRPLPLGIPQLTNKCRSTRSMHGKTNWATHSAGTLGIYQRTFPAQRSRAKNLRVTGYRDQSVSCN